MEIGSTPFSPTPGGFTRSATQARPAENDRLAPARPGAGGDAAGNASGNEATSVKLGRGTGDAPSGLSPSEQKEVDALKAIDRNVRAHELAHMSAGSGVVTGGPSFSTRRGPDGQSYAVAGEVPIDTSKGRTPEETIARAQAIRRAALAPADPSGQDRAVAAKAGQMEAEARRELAARSSTAGDSTERTRLYEANTGEQRGPAALIAIA